MALEQILAAKRRRQLSDRPSAMAPAVPCCGDGFLHSLQSSDLGFILECKAASPSAGVLIENYAPGKLAKQFDSVASAISVLTEPEFFGGSLSHLDQVRSAVKAPVLRKDFILGAHEVQEARAHGADAVLLMLSVLDDVTWQSCFDQARRLKMDVLTEVHDEDELERALALKAPIIGINNRNLKTLQTDLSVTERLAPLIPRDRYVISESGITGREDIYRLGHLVNGFLVGSGLSRQQHPGRAARELIYGRVKVCGLSLERDAVDAWTLGATMGGLIFAPGSPRQVDFEVGRRLVAAAPDLMWVGVYRDQPEAEIAEHAKKLNLAAVQLHGRENGSYCRQLRQILPADCRIWKAVEATRPIPAPRELGADRVLIDSRVSGYLGGTGKAFDASLLRGQALEHCILAGGVSRDNLDDAVSLGPWMIDINSGVESAPGHKDARKLSEVMRHLRSIPRYRRK